VLEATVRSRQFACALLFSLFFSTGGNGQGIPPRLGAPPQGRGDISGDNSDAQREMAHDMAKKANEQRQSSLKNDTEKLVKLSAELKDYVDKSNESILSLDVIKKAEEIEKLAHSVKEKMKGPG
jgi:hypothetical protein